MQGVGKEKGSAAEKEKTCTIAVQTREEVETCHTYAHTYCCTCSVC